MEGQNALAASPKTNGTRVFKGQGDPSGLLSTLEHAVEDMRSLITCKICLMTMFEPYTISCGHSYCYSCISQWLVTNKAKRTCPGCRARITEQPAPSYIIREMARLISSRAELLPAGETTEEHEIARREEAGIVERDKTNTDLRTGGLFRGCFKNIGHPVLNIPIHDAEDGVYRCPDCMHEIEDDYCTHCGRSFEDEDNDYADTDYTQEIDSDVFYESDMDERETHIPGDMDHHEAEIFGYQIHLDEDDAQPGRLDPPLYYPNSGFSTRTRRYATLDEHGAPAREHTNRRLVRRIRQNLGRPIRPGTPRLYAHSQETFDDSSQDLEQQDDDLSGFITADDDDGASGREEDHSDLLAHEGQDIGSQDSGSESESLLSPVSSTDGYQLAGAGGFTSNHESTSATSSVEGVEYNTQTPGQLGSGFSSSSESETEMPVPRKRARAVVDDDSEESESEPVRQSRRRRLESEDPPNSTGRRARRAENISSRVCRRPAGNRARPIVLDDSDGSEEVDVEEEEGEGEREEEEEEEEEDEEGDEDAEDDTDDGEEGAEQHPPSRNSHQAPRRDSRWLVDSRRKNEDLTHRPPAHGFGRPGAGRASGSRAALGGLMHL